jgi:hypothetical protein
MKEKHHRLHQLDFAVSLGVIIGLAVFLINILSQMNLFGGFPVMVLIFKDLYGTIGYSQTALGAILVGLYAFVDTFILALLFAWIYNKLLSRTSKI